MNTWKEMEVVNIYEGRRSCWLLEQFVSQMMEKAFRDGDQMRLPYGDGGGWGVWSYWETHHDADFMGC